MRTISGNPELTVVGRKRGMTKAHYLMIADSLMAAPALAPLLPASAVPVGAPSCMAADTAPGFALLADDAEPVSCS